MKVIKEGKRPELKVYRMDCGNCKAVFEFKKNETRVVFDQRDGDYMEVICPCCSTKLTHAL